MIIMLVIMTIMVMVIRLSYYIFCSALRLATCIEAAGEGKITIEGRLETNILIVKVFKIQIKSSVSLRFS